MSVTAVSLPVRTVAMVAALLVAGWVGHGVGRLDAEQAERRSQATAREVAALRLAAQAGRDEAEVARARHEAQVRALREAFAEEKAEMMDALDEIQSRQAEVTDRRFAREAALRHRGDQVAVLQARLRRIEADRSCLSHPVPAQALTSLDRGGRPGRLLVSR